MKIKLLAIDIDGVMTNGTKLYDLDGNVMGKHFHDHDFSSINRIKNRGVKIVFLSKDDRVNMTIAKKRKIPFIHVKQNEKKVDYLNYICDEFNVKPCNIAYIGDDTHDIEMLKSVKYAFCPSDAIPDVKDICTILRTESGKGVLKELEDYV